jgi:hypothetical protein
MVSPLLGLLRLKGSRIVPIQLIRITEVGSSRFRLDFLDGETEVSFVLEYVPQKWSFVITREFDDYFYGRSSAREAFAALHLFVEGEPVSLPIQVREDGFTGRA